MKIFKDWKENDIPSFVMFLAKEAQRQKRRMRYYYEKFAKDGEVNSMNVYQIQQGQAVEADTLFTIAKEHFHFHKRKS
jgi:hypothetical protein